MIVCLNGKMVAAAAAPSPAEGIFEMIAVRGGVPKRINAHLARLRHGAGAQGLPLTLSDLSLGNCMAETLIANALPDAMLRVSVSADGFHISAGPLPLQPTPAKARIGQTKRYDRRPRVKLINDPDNAAARQEAYGHNVDDVLLFNGDGRLVDASAANVFLLLHGGLVTPALTDGVLPGTVRGELISRFRAEERSLTLDDLRKASEIFLSSTVGLRPVIELDGQPVGDGETGLVTAMLATRV